MNMKKILLSLLMLVLLIGLSACDKEKAIPLENPEPELFSVLYESDEYSVLKRDIITEQLQNFGIHARPDYEALPRDLQMIKAKLVGDTNLRRVKPIVGMNESYLIQNAYA